MTLLHQCTMTPLHHWHCAIALLNCTVILRQGFGYLSLRQSRGHPAVLRHPRLTCRGSSKRINEERKWNLQRSTYKHGMAHGDEWEWRKNSSEDLWRQTLAGVHSWAHLFCLLTVATFWDLHSLCFTTATLSFSLPPTALLTICSHSWSWSWWCAWDALGLTFVCCEDPRCVLIVCHLVKI